jgi:hypothetical protein
VSRSTVYTAERIRSEAAKEFAKGTPLPEAIRKIDARGKRPSIALVSDVYWRLRGEANPVVAKTAKGIATEVAKRRLAGERYEVLRYALAARLGRSVARAEIDSLLAAKDLDSDATYTGRGTRKSRSGEATRSVRSSS